MVISVFLSITVPHVASNRFHILTSQDQPCPGQFTGDPCITLQQYARGEHITDPDAPLPNNVILDLQPGIHSLSSVLTSSNMDSFEMRGENATIRCTVFSNSLSFTFQRIQSFQISNINFTGCLPLVLSQITNSSIVNTSFFNMLGRCLVVQSSSVLLKRSTFIGNSVRLKQSYFTREPIQNCRGGAVDSQQSTISVEQCSFRYNRATCRIFVRRFRDTVGGWGGAIATRQNTIITIANSMFIGNSAGEHGGAVYVDGGSISVENSSFLFNSVGLLRTQVGYRLREESRGAISVNDINSNSVTINQSNFINNTAATGGGFFISVDRDTPEEIDISIAESSFVNNEASSNRGGGIMYISTDRTRISLHQSSFINNTAGGSGGGGMYVSGNRPRINVYHSNFTNNTAGGTGGGGGGMYVSGDHTLISVHQSNFANNSVVERGTVGGALKVSGQNSSITILQSSFINNTASQLQGGEGGALNTNGHNTRILFTESIFANNSALACAVLNAEGSDLNVTFTRSVFTYNKVSEISTQSDADIQANSGGVACVNSASVSITNSSFRNNAASRHAGVLSVEGSRVSIKGSNFHNNQAGHDGGVIFTRVSPITLSVTQSSFTNNWAGGNGGVMNVARSGSRLDITDSNFSFNEASQRGGALAIAGSELNINQTTIYNNMAALGGVISACNSVVTVSEALTFSEDPGNNFQCTFYDGNTTATDTSTTVGPTVLRVASNRFHIITSQDQSCPGQFTGDPCITLQQYARGEHITDPDAPLPNNVILDLQPGIHSLSSVLTSSNMDSFEMRGENATIRCTVFSNSLPFTFQRIQSFQISNINFTGCLPLVLSQITNSSIVNTSFFNMLGRCLVVQSSSVLLKRSTFIGNSVRLKQSYFTREPIQNCRGGAVDSQQSTISVEQCSFRYNRATCRIFVRRFRDTVGGWGGAIATRQNTIITIANSMFIGNSAGEHGGAVYVDGGSISVENSSFLFNSVGLLRAQVGYRLWEESGGAISVNDINSNSVTINQSNFINNTAATGGGIFISVDRDTPDELDISIAESSFVNNEASSNRGGGIMYISTDRTRISLHQSSFINNTAGGSGGGGMYVSGNRPRINVYHSNFTNNTAGGTGGGGGMYVSGGHTLISVHQSNFANNSVVERGTVGGALKVSGQNSLITILQSSFINNTASQLQGGEGGALNTNGHNTRILFTESIFANNSAFACAVLNAEGSDLNVTFTRSVFTYNKVSEISTQSDADIQANSGGVACVNSASVSITNSSFRNNAASRHAGVLSVEGSRVSIKGSNFHNNQAGHDGGVIFTRVSPITLSVTQSSFTNNWAGGNGGVMNVARSGSRLDITDSNFSFNEASQRGGALAIAGSELNINQTTIYNNMAALGGVISACNSVVTVSEALTFSEDPGNNFQCTFYDGNTTATDTSTTVGPTVPRVASNRFHIITSQDQSCPGQFTGDPCITLQQYARGEHITDPDAPLPNNVILDLQPGIHSLSSVLTSSNMDSFEMRGENATIRCTVFSNSLPFTFQRIQSFQISNINFTGCLPLVLSQITNSSIVNTSFFNMLGRCLVVQSSSVLLKRSTFIGNSVRLKQSYFTRESIQNCRGGAVDSQQSTISVEQCSFRYNRATCRIFVRRFRDTVGGWGGAIATRQNTIITIANSMFIGNSAGEHGGAVYVDGGSISVENSSFLFNSVGLLRAQVGYRLREESGGAISVNDINSNSVTINQSNFINNTAATGGGIFISVDRDTPDELDISIAESSFVNNEASSNRGGGIMYISTDRTCISLHQSSFINNTAGGSGGGGMYVSGNRPRINVYHSNFTNNTAGGTGGGGGGMYVSGDHTLISVQQSNFANNSVVERGTVGGALKVSGQNSSITILQSSFINNTASQLQGGEGGALNTNGHNTRILFTESIFANNSAFACAVLNAEGSDLNVAFTGSVFTYNKVSEISTQSDADIQANSGGVACVNSASVSITNSSFRNNAASRHAGVLNVEGSTVSIKGSNFHNNQAGHDGGVIFTRVSPITLSVTQSSFTNNWAGGNGGVMNVARSGSRLDINDSNFSFNEASQRGGALAIAGSELNINQTTVYNNMAALGGVISACNSVVTVSEALTFSEDPGNNFQCTFYDGNTTATDTSTTVGPTVPRVASNRFHIITSQDQSCPGQFTGDPCITLQQYARGEHITDPDAPLPNNVILVLQPGIHSLSAVLTSSNMDSFEMRGENATIRCTVFSNSLPFTFQRIQSFQISSINFTGCLPLVLSQITNSSIVNTSFFNMLGRCLVVQSSSVLLKRSTFIGNSVRLKQSYFTREPIQNCRGGAVDSQQSTISVEQCSFRYNRATCRIFVRRFRDTVGGWGGAIATRQNTIITIANGMFIGNSAGEHGGAVYVDGGSISVENSSFLFNSVGLLRAQVGYRLREESGGAISVNDINSNSVTINQSNFINNTAATGGGFFISVDRDTPDELDISIAESSFVNNEASSNRGGGIMCISTDRTRISLHQSSFINNTAGGSGGGGMYVSGNRPRINVYHSNFTNNTAGGTGGGGGGMYVSGDHTLISVHQSNFANNSVVERGTVGGALKVSGQNSSITILQSSFINNTASQLQGGEGGALNTNGHNTRILFTESIFVNNSAFACAVLNAERSNLNVAFTGSVFTYNKVSEISTQSDADIQANSGGVACVNSASISITNSSFRNNAASRHAGVLNVEGSTVSIKGSNFHNNQAGHDGGVIFTRVSPITLSVTQSSFTNNWAGGNGGVMNVARSGSRLDITNSNFSFNEASQRGGALAIAGSELNINQTTVYNNMAALGGVISACNSVVTVSEALTFSEDPGNNFQCTFYDGNTTATDTSTTVGPTVPRVASNRFHIITSQDQPCPGQFTGDPCITLQQYARGEHITDPDAPLPSNVILDLQPGIHSLSSVLTSSNMDSFEMRGENATIRCTVFSNSLSFTFQRIQSFQISNINFTGCLPLVLSQITNSSIVNTSFFNMLGRCLVVQSFSVLLKRSTFIGNSVRLKRSYFTREPIQNCRGGAVDSQQSTISVEQCSFRYNRATCRIFVRRFRDTVGGWGGAIATRQNTIITIANSMFIGNSAGEHGGAVYVDGGSISVENSSFLFNSVGLLRAQVGYRLREESGGAISVNDINSNSVTINQSNFINNTAATGGGFFISVDRDTPDELDISIAESSFVNNEASSNRGGGIMYISTDRTRISLHQSSFINNTAGGSGGGGMYVSGNRPRINVYHSNFTNNTAGGTGGGGGMYVSGDHTLISVQQSNFANNSVVERGTVGGALKVSGQNSLITILQSSFINNTASQLQGGEGGALNTNGHNTRILFTESIFANNSAFACAVLNAEGSDLNVAFTGSV